ncbi:protein translocase subunit SecD [Candidatus Parcubacteria bacterium]|nr:MAG: protein translocase subunit SecD [Candidatus Parcubacteria bacterium]
MKNPKIFVLIIFLFSIPLFVLDLPSLKKVWVPFVNKSIELDKYINTSSISLDFGLFQIQKDVNYRLGLDLQGGTKLTYKIDMSNVPEGEEENAFESSRTIVEKRINFFGVSEPTLQTLKIGSEYRLTVELPGMTNVNEAIELIGKTAQLSFWEQGEGSKSAQLSSGSASLFPLGVTEVLGNNPVKTKLTGKDLKSAKVVFDQNTGQPQVQLNFSPEGGKLFADITKRNVGKPLVIVLDNQLIEAPNVIEPILNGDAVINGSFTTQTAKNLAIQLNAGALPAPLEVIAQNTVGPSLGIESLKKSLFAGFLGLLSIIIFMVYLYRKEGIIASLALFVYTIIVLFIFKFIPITLTLAGIAGFILSIGMAVDANVLIFERMKEEFRAGKPKDIALRIGFLRAWTSIRDSNVSSLITCFILFYFGTGIVRGFALTLAIGILVSMFSAIIVTRNLLSVLDINKK